MGTESFVQASRSWFECTQGANRDIYVYSAGGAGSARTRCVPRGYRLERIGRPGGAHVVYFFRPARSWCRVPLGARTCLQDRLLVLLPQ